MPRVLPKKIKKIVIKIGSSSIADYKRKPRTAQLRSLVKQICHFQKQNIDVVLVSSGAIVLGLGEVAAPINKNDIVSLQALAAIGQTVLMRTYSNLFSKNQRHCAQILLTWDDFDNRLRRNNAKKTIEAILSKKIVPIINENDTIATDEIKFGDNDKLSAFVASLLHADLLILLSDVEGLYNFQNGRKKVYKEVKEITREIVQNASGPQKGWMSKGGMAAKLEAIEIAAHAKIPCIIANSQTRNVLTRILEGECLGTFFVEKEERLLARKHWISFVAKPKGKLWVDQGAKEALLKGGASLLLPGIIKWQGHFKSNDVVIVCDKFQHEFARGIVNYSVEDFYVMQKNEEKRGKREVIHCNNLILCKRELL